MYISAAGWFNSTNVPPRLPINTTLQFCGPHFSDLAFAFLAATWANGQPFTILASASICGWVFYVCFFGLWLVLVCIYIYTSYDRSPHPIVVLIHTSSGAMNTTASLSSFSPIAPCCKISELSERACSNLASRTAVFWNLTAGCFAILPHQRSLQNLSLVKTSLHNKDAWKALFWLLFSFWKHTRVILSNANLPVPLLAH